MFSNFDIDIYINIRNIPKRSLQANRWKFYWHERYELSIRRRHYHRHRHIILWTLMYIDVKIRKLYYKWNINETRNTSRQLGGWPVAAPPPRLVAVPDLCFCRPSQGWYWNIVLKTFPIYQIKNFYWFLSCLTFQSCGKYATKEFKSSQNHIKTSPKLCFFQAGMLYSVIQ